VFDWITGFVEQAGYMGIAFLMFAENVFPPIPSEVIMPLSGFTAARGDRNIVLVVLAGAFGSLLGAVLWYYIGQWVGAARLKRWAARHGRWMTIAPDEVDHACTWFRRHGAKAVFLGRLVPAVRTLISIPAGIAAMPLVPFLVYSALGSVLWTALLASAGYLLEDQYQKVSGYVGPVSNAVIAILVLWYLYRVATFGRHVEQS
jgi:membrane protein DedA with SNARE-associated domain